jgi:hypothetical protein
MPADFAISLTGLRPNRGRAAAKPRPQTRFFDPISISLKYLHAIFAQLSGLRRRCDKPEAEVGQLFFDRA